MSSISHLRPNDGPHAFKPVAAPADKSSAAAIAKRALCANKTIANLLKHEKPEAYVDSYPKCFKVFEARELSPSPLSKECSKEGFLKN